MNQTSSSATVQKFLMYLFALRIQIIGFLLLWPLAGVAFSSSLLRGLPDIGNSEVAFVSVLAAGHAVFLAVATSLVLLWVDLRLKGERARVTPQPGRLLRARRFVSVVSILFWGGFMADVRSGSSASQFWVVAVSVLLVVVFTVVLIEELVNATRRRSLQYRLFVLPLPGISNDSFAAGRAFFNSAGHRRRRRRRRLRTKVDRVRWRLRRRMLTWADVLLGPGFLDYAAKRPRRFLPGYFIAFAWLVFLVVTFEDAGWQFSHPELLFNRFRLMTPSPLSMVLTGALLLVAILSFLSFYADRFHLPLSIAVLSLMACATYVSGVDHQFWSERLQPGSLNEAATPREVIESSPRKLIVVAAAGGGIHASGWTAQVLAGLREGAQGQAFKRALRVISGVSGGAVGAAFYAGTYDGVWSEKAYSLDEARSRAMASSLSAVSWGLVYPDMHRLLLPIPRWLWRDEDRGTSLERSIASTAGRSPGPRLLSLAPLVKNGFPVLLLNATLSADALPVTFTNSRYPDPSVKDVVVRIGSFHEDFQRDTRLETAARLSATFPIVSPAARPGEYVGLNTFVDGGYFDNSGLYALMAWLTQAAPPLTSGTQRHDVLLLMIEPFPESPNGAPTAANVSWYRQFTIPLETVWGVHATGQEVRNRYELPLLKRFLDDRFNVHELQFRYAPSKGCEKPPLSWHLTSAEKKCIADAWNQPTTREARRYVDEWLKDDR